MSIRKNNIAQRYLCNIILFMFMIKVPNVSINLAGIEDNF